MPTGSSASAVPSSSSSSWRSSSAARLAVVSSSPAPPASGAPHEEQKFAPASLRDRSAGRSSTPGYRTDSRVDHRGPGQPEVVGKAVEVSADPRDRPPRIRRGAQLVEGDRRRSQRGRAPRSRGRAAQEVRLVERQPDEQDRAVLQHRAPRWTWAEPQSLRSPTRRSAPCCPAKHAGPVGPPARRDRGGRRRAEASPAISAGRELPVDGVDAPGDAARPWHRDRVGQVARRAGSPGRRWAGARPRLRAAGRRRDRRRRRAGTGRATAPAATTGRAAAPAVHPPRPRRAARDPRPSARRRVRGVSRSSTNRQVSATTDGFLLLLDELPVGGRVHEPVDLRRDRAMSMAKIQPSPYGSWLSCSGASSSASFTSATVPPTGA